MAELFGIVAGGIGATSLAIQIIEKTCQVNALLKSIKDMPSEVHDMLLEIEVLASILRDMEEVYRLGPQTSMTTSAAKVIELCKNIEADLQLMAKELEARSSGTIKKHSLKSIKAVLRKKRINGMTLRIQRASGLLMMCNQVYMHNSLSTTLKTILDNSTRPSCREIASITQKPLNDLTLSPLKSHSAQSPLRQLGRVTWTSINSYWVAIGCLTSFNGQSHLSKRLRRHTALTRASDEDDVWRLHFHPASWFGHRLFIVSAHNLCVDWQYKMVSYNLRDPDAAIFIACQNGDIETVHQLLHDGLASPFDLTPDGETPLHIAALVASSEICQLLIDSGADGNFSALPGEPTPLMCLAQQAYKHDNETNSHELNDRVKVSLWDPTFDRSFVGPRATAREVLDTVRVLVEKGQSDPMIGTNGDGGLDQPSVLFGWQGPSEPFLWLLRQDHFDVDIERRDGKLGRSIFHSKASPSPSKSGPRLMLDALFEEKNYSTLTNARDTRGDTVLHLASKKWCFTKLVSEKLRSNDPKDNASYTLVQRLLEIGSDAHAQNHDGYTPLDLIIDEIIIQWRIERDADYHRDYELLWRTTVRSWFAALVNAGYRLREYAETEHSLRPNGLLKNVYATYKKDWVFCAVRRIFLYGDGPNDVDVDLEMVEIEEIENGESPDISDDESSQETEEPLKVPGSWQ